MDETKGLMEELDLSIKQLISESKDPEYTAYLQKMQERLIQQKYQIDLLKAELDRSHTMYLRRMELMDAQKTQISDSVVLEEENKTDIAVENVAEITQQYIHDEKIIPAQSASSKKQHNTEFAVGAAVLSVVGGGFILAALVTLGMTFMGGLFKGICLYAVAVAFLLVSELFLYRKWPMLGATFSSIGIGGLYLSTAVNYLGLHNFNLWFTLCITLIITFFVIILSRKRDSVLYRIIGMIAGYMCFFTIREGITETEFVVVSGMILLMNILCILFPVRKSRTAIHITHMSINTFFAIFFVIRAMAGCDLGQLSALVFVISSIVIMQMLFVAQFFYYKKESSKSCYEGFLSAYYSSVVCYLIMVCILAYSLVDISMNNWYAYGSAIVLGIIGLISLIILTVRKCSGQGHIYTFLNLIFYCLVGFVDGEWGYVICLLSLLVVVKAVSWRNPSTVYRVNDIMITLCLCLSTLLFDAPYVYALFVGVLFSILMMKYWQTFYEVVLTFVIVIYTANHLPEILQLPAVVGILLVGILLYNNVKRWQGRHILVFNIFALIGQIICFLKLSSSVYQDEYITYLCMLVFGIATIILTLQEKYRMNCRGKYLILAVFLTYMAFILRVDIPVVNSVLLMVIALICVGMGFALNNKSVRIYGLVLSLVVCGKLVLYDFFEAATVQKTILFFAVGAIALIIAAIYIVLEKKNNS